jgi:DNA-binding CsgD family transcriptional regulator
MNFMLRREPSIDDFHRSVFLFSSVNNDKIQLEDALFSGNNAVYNTLRKQGSLSVIGKIGELSIYGTPDGASFVGLDKAIRLYPNDSPFADARFVVALIVPWQDFYGSVSASRLRLMLVGAVLLCVGIALSLFLSDRYEKPFRELLDALRSGNIKAKTQIQEIDDLLEFMRSQLNETRIAVNGNKESTEDDEENMEKPSKVSTESLLESFIANTKKLSRAEADVFNLYLEGYTAKEIASMLTLSINTIKTHNRNIFAKLNVSSRKELLTWVQVFTASGLLQNDSQQRQFDRIRDIVKNIKGAPDIKA